MVFDDVEIIDENTTYIGNDVVIGKGTIIYPNVTIRGKTVIGENNVIESNTVIVDSKIGNDNTIGPFAHIHSNTVIGDKNIIGNFVEIKDSIINDQNKIKHLSYIGNTKMDDMVNIGAGVVMANYNPLDSQKYDTTIESKVFVGSNSSIIAPVTLKKNSLVGAGSTITDDVKENSLALARARQVEKIDYRK